MKKLVLGLICLMFLCGCGKITEENIVKEFSNKLSKSSSYHFDGNMTIYSNEEKFEYKIDISYLKDNYYKAILVNQNNNHEQVILRNEDGVYVITPSLNKSFKFQSEWPHNSSQAYILKSLLKDFKNDKDLKYEKTNDGYIIKSKVNYPNNSNLTYEKVYFDKDINPIKVEVYNNNDGLAIRVDINKIDYKTRLNKEDFSVDNYINNECCSDDSCDNPCQNSCDGEECAKKSSSLDSAIYPLYIPEDSVLSSSEKIQTDNGNRQILTFAGDKDFVIVEETATISKEMELIPVYGDPYILTNSVVALGANSLYWNDNNVSFYLASNSLSGEEMLTIASSMANSEEVLLSK